MTIELFFSNQLEELALKLAEMLDAAKSDDPDIFQAPHIITPNQNLTKWLQLALTRERGVLMHTRFMFLEEGLWNLLSAIEVGQSPPLRLDHLRLKIILRYILDQAHANEEQDLILNYLQSGADKTVPDLAARIWQISERLAYYFQEYEYHRYEMIYQWVAGKVIEGEMAKCQRKLYRACRAVKDQYEAVTGIRLLSLPEYADAIFNRTTLVEPASKKTIHLFGLSQVSTFHLWLIERLQIHYDIFIYTLNPSQEFWEDIQTPYEKRWILRSEAKSLIIRPEEKSAGEILQPSGNTLLSLWGKPGREHIRLLCQLTDYRFHTCFASTSEKASLLPHIQQRILTLSESHENETHSFPQDRSLQIMACPSELREVETIYNNIVYNLEQDPHLQLTDFAVMVPDIAIYKPIVEAVFSRTPRRLSYNIVDTRADTESLYGKAVLAIINLAMGKFSRKEVFELLLNPCVIKRWDLQPEDILIWSNWSEKLNIFHSYDADTKSELGYSGSAHYTWLQGLQRLRLSRIMASPQDSGDPYTDFQDRVPYRDWYTADTDQLEKFSLIIETLHQAASELKSLYTTATQWKAVLLGICDRLIEPPRHLKGEGAVQRSLIQALDTLCMQDDFHAPPDRLDIALIREYLRTHLSGITGGYGEYLTGGVTVSALQPMRPIPFKIIYVLGMQEGGGFPGKADQSVLDLRLQKRRIGDVNLPERNRYLFLELLLSARDKLYISYVCRNLQKDRHLQPCVLVNQLRRYIETEIWGSRQIFQISQIPLNGYSSRYLVDKAVNAWSDVLVNYSTADRIVCYRSSPLWERFMEKASPSDHQRIKALNPELSSGLPQPTLKKAGAQTIDLGYLRQFLRNPVAAYIRMNLESSQGTESIEDLSDQEDEPFFSGFPWDYQFRVDTLTNWINEVLVTGGHWMDVTRLNDWAEKIYAHFVKIGRMPEGAFAHMDKSRLETQIRQTAEGLLPVLSAIQSQPVVFGDLYIGSPSVPWRGSGNRLQGLHFEPLYLFHSEDAPPVSLQGQLQWVWKDPMGHPHALVLTGSEKAPRHPDHRTFYPVLFYLACLSDRESHRWIGDTGMTFHLVFATQIQSIRYRFTPEKAKNYLAQLVCDALKRSPPEWIPFDILEQLSVKPYRPSDTTPEENLQNRFLLELMEAFTEQPYYPDHFVQPVIPSDAYTIVKNRFQPFFEGEKVDAP